MKIKNRRWSSIRYCAEMMDLNFKHADEVRSLLNRLLSEIKTQDIEQKIKK